MQKSKVPDWKGVRCLMVVLIGLLLFIYRHSSKEDSHFYKW